MAARSKFHLACLGALATLSTLAAVSTAVAQTPDQKKAIEDRQALFKQIDEAFKPVGDMVKRKIPYNAQQVQDSAAKLATLAPKIGDAFKVDTHTVTGVKTKARENIWTNMPDFKAKADALVKTLDMLAEAGKAGDEKSLRPAFATVGKACSACHDNYKNSSSE